MACFKLLSFAAGALGLLLACSACQSSRPHQITLKDGRQFQCRGEPDFVRKTGYYRYRNFHGRDALIRADEVLLIEELAP
jgi:hypothetical protein